MIWAIGDLHFDHTGEKSMDIFGENWANHEERIIKNWIENVNEDDLVLVPGDISWALKFNESLIDLQRINELPGYKVLSKGNHDYWWPTKKKLSESGLDTIHFLHNDYFKYKDYIIFGARGWIPRDSDNFEEDDEKIFSRELNRLRLSFNSFKNNLEDNKIIAMLHYPPFNSDGSVNEFVEILKEYDVNICIYGHLHDEGHEFIQEGIIEGIRFYCVSSDYLDFKLENIL